MTNHGHHGLKYTYASGEIPAFHQRFSYGSGIGTRFSIEENAGKNASGEVRDIAQDKGNHLQYDGISGGVRCQNYSSFTRGDKR
jgi:hypothetical protein